MLCSAAGKNREKMAGQLSYQFTCITKVSDLHTLLSPMRIA
jgi:hypothetical protein